jgi:hypothetical protein
MKHLKAVIDRKDQAKAEYGASISKDEGIIRRFHAD